MARVATDLYRSLWQHCTVERYCMAVWPRQSAADERPSLTAQTSLLEALLSPLMGRFVASIGEYVFVASQGLNHHNLEFVTSPRKRHWP